MSLSPNNKKWDMPTAEAEVARLERLLEAAGNDGAASSAEITHTLMYFLWPEVKNWKPEAVPPALGRMIAMHAIAAGVTPDLSPEEADQRMEKFFERFEPNLALLRELEDLGLWVMDNGRDRSSAQKLINDQARGSGQVSNAATFKASPLLRSTLGEKDSLEKPFR